MSSHTVTVLTQDKFALPIQIHSPKQTPKGVIVYYHGGGLIAGTPHDLPPEVIALFTEHFYLAEAPYRLAPEAKIDTIMSDALCVFDAVFAKYPDLPSLLSDVLPAAFLHCRLHVSAMSKVCLISMVSHKLRFLN